MLVVQSVFRCRHGEELGPFCWAMLATGIAALMHLVDVLSILLICNGFSGIQKALVDQTGSRPPNSDHDFFFFGASLALGSALELLLSPTTQLVIAGCHIKSIFFFWLHVTIQSRNGSLSLHRIREDNTSKWHFFWFSVSSWGTHLPSFFTIPICFRHWMTRMVNIEFLGNFTCSFKRISFSDCSQLVVVNFLWPATMLLTFKSLVSVAKLLEPPLHCMFFSSSRAKWVDVASCLWTNCNMIK